MPLNRQVIAEDSFFNRPALARSLQKDGMPTFGHFLDSPQSPNRWSDDAFLF
jgi:hypothetical protein